MDSKNNTTVDITKIQHALFTINRHAKTALNSKELYNLKKNVLKKLIKENLAEKVSLEFSHNPREGLQSSVVLVRVGSKDSEQPFYFHTPMEKGDSKMKHRGKINNEIRNPQIRMRLETAKSILYRYLGENPPRKRIHQNSKNNHLKNVFVSSYLDGRRRY